MSQEHFDAAWSFLPWGSFPPFYFFLETDVIAASRWADKIAESLVSHETAGYSLGPFPEGQEELVPTHVEYGQGVRMCFAISRKLSILGTT